MKRSRKFSILTATVLSAAIAASAIPSTARAADAPATQPALNSELNDAIKQLATSGDLNAADDAVAKLQQVMLQQTRQVIIAQKILLNVQTSLARELSALTGIKDAEGQARVAGLLDFNAAIYTWASNTAALAPEERDAVLDWGLQSDHLPLVAKIYGHDSEAKTDAIHALAKFDQTPATDYMFEVLLNDKDREVSLSALDSLFDRKPSPALVDIICDRAFGWIQNQNRNTQQRQHIINVHGRQQVYYDNNGVNNSQQDSEFYIDLLQQYHDPKIGARFDAVLGELADSVTTPNDSRIMQIISSNYASSQNFSRLIDTYKPKNAVKLCVKVLQFAPGNSQEANLAMNGVMGQYHMSTHVDAMAMLLTATGQDLNDYGIVKQENYNRWAVPGTAVDENDSLKKVHDWLEKHGKEVGIDAPGTFAPAPAPANAVRRNNAAPANNMP